MHASEFEFSWIKADSDMFMVMVMVMVMVGIFRSGSMFKIVFNFASDLECQS